MDGEDVRSFDQSLREAVSTADGREVDVVLTELGWHDALGESPQQATRTWFVAQGELGASSTALDAVVALALGLPTTTTAVVMPQLGRYDAPGSLAGNHLTVHGIATHRALTADHVVVVAGDQHEHVMTTASTARLEIRQVRGVDPAGRWVAVEGELDIAQLSPRSADGWAEAVINAQLACASELVGASRTMLTLACQHAVGRVQFDRPVAQFQAVRHLLANALVAVEAADGAVSASWAEPSALNAAMAKAIAGRSARTVARHCQQVLAGIGFTHDHAFHRYLRRSLILDQLFGAGVSLSEEIARRAIAAKSVPPILAL